jgi:hypothetical protein
MLPVDPPEERANHPSPKRRTINSFSHGQRQEEGAARRG